MNHFGIVLGFDNLGAVRPSIKYLKSCGLTPFIVTNEYGADYSDTLPEALTLRSTNVNRDHRELTNEITSKLSKYSASKKWEVSAVINFQDRMWLSYIALRSAFPNAQGLDHAVVEKTTIKPNFRYLTRNTQWAVPYLLLPINLLSNDALLSYAPLQNLIETHQSIIIKPILGMGGLGVQRFNKLEAEEHLVEAVRHVFHIQQKLYDDNLTVNFLELQPNLTSFVNEYVLIEKYINGTEYSVEGIADFKGEIRNVILQEKTLREERPIFRDLEYVAFHPASESDAIVTCVAEIIKIVGFTSGPFHIEIKRDGTGTAKPIEFNPRMGGGSIVDLASAIHGVDLQAAGLFSRIRSKSPQRIYLTTVLQPKPEEHGKIVSYVGLEIVSSDPRCVFLKKIISEGTIIERAAMEIYLVEFCIIGEHIAETKSFAKKLLNSIKVNFEPHNPERLAE